MQRRIFSWFLAAFLALLGVPASLVVEARSETVSVKANMSHRVDRRLAERWRSANVAPATRSGDAEFLRRLHLDLTGQLPSVAEARRFLADSDPEKRPQAIDKLLDSPAFASHLAVIWRNRLLAPGIELSDVENAIGLESWLRQQFRGNLRYDNLVAEFLVAQGDARSGPALYYTSLELKPEKLAASTARIFLGLRIECAECHDHPFDDWTQRDFWGYAAFFAQLEQPTDVESMGRIRLRDRAEGEVRLPGADEILAPRFPGGHAAAKAEYGTRRAQLAIWLASQDNPYLSRAAVNVVWSQLFGRGLVHPIDDHGSRNPPSHPELLAELADYFTEIGFDQKELYRTLLLTDAYQLSSQVSGAVPPAELFARMQPKTLTAEQLYQCLQRSVGTMSATGGADDPLTGSLPDPQRLAFLARMPPPGDDSAAYPIGLPQALLLMNGPTISGMTSPSQSRLLQAVEAPFWTRDDQLEILTLATLTRFPTAHERERWNSYLETFPADQQLDALGDILWAILNSAEFMMNH